MTTDETIVTMKNTVFLINYIYFFLYLDPTFGEEVIRLNEYFRWSNVIPAGIWRICMHTYFFLYSENYKIYLINKTTIRRSPERNNSIIPIRLNLRDYEREEGVCRNLAERRFFFLTLFCIHSFFLVNRSHSRVKINRNTLQHDLITVYVSTTAEGSCESSWTITEMQRTCFLPCRNIYTLHTMYIYYK